MRICSILIMLGLIGMIIVTVIDPRLISVEFGEIWFVGCVWTLVRCVKKGKK